MMEEKPIIFDELYQAYIDCRERKKNTSGAKVFEKHAFYSIQVLADEINSRKYKLRPSECFVIKYPVPREVFCASFRDRIVQHFVYNELNPVLDRMLIRDTASCRVGKGTDYAIDRLERFVRRETNNYTEDAFFGKADLSGFFMSLVRQRILDLMLDIVWNHYQGCHKEVLSYLLEIIIMSDVTFNATRLCPEEDWELIPPHKTLFGNDYGLPIGNITSQMFANFYLNDMDHMIKSRHHSYIRYVDDFIIVDQDREKIEETLDIVNEYLPGIHQKLNSKKTYIRNVKYGIPFLGVIVKPYYTCLAPSRINRIYYTSRGIDEDKFVASGNSRKGMFDRYHGHRVAKRWFNSQPEKLKENIRMGSNHKFVNIRKPKKKQTELIKM